MHLNNKLCRCNDCQLRASWAEFGSGDYVTLQRWKDDSYTHEVILTFSDIEFTRSFLTKTKEKCCERRER